MLLSGMRSGEEGLKFLRDLREKIETLEIEQASLSVEVEELKKLATDRASKLESEVTTLRKEVRALKKLVGIAKIKKNSTSR